MPREAAGMKLYVWTDVQALRAWSSGLAFAMAHSLEEAIDLIYDGDDIPGLDIPRLKEELKSSPPQIFDRPHGFFVFGGA
jgi:hypothetical protein